MALAVGTGAAGFAGRTAERALLGRTLDAAAGGSPGVVVIRGEAGIGKTRLVAQAVRDAREFTVLWGSCLQLDTLALPYLPFVGALEARLEQAAASDRDRLLEAVPGLRDVLPSLGAAGPPGSEGVPATFVRALAHVASVGPTVLVVDDVQWADAASLDVLAYAVAGLRAQRLAVLLTLRTDQLAEGDRLHGWLADLRRLPSVAEIDLPRMGADDTAALLTTLLGRPPGVELVVDVLRHSQGNPYFTELLAREVDPGSGQLPEELPEALQAALLAGWHRLPPPARQVTRLLAVCGHPVEGDVLVAAAKQTVAHPAATAEALHAAEDAGVVVADRSRLWFRHPLLAHVLFDQMLPPEREAAHAALVAALSASPRPPPLADLSRHYEGARLPDQALTASLAAASEAARLEAREEEAELRLRAARLWPLASGEARATAGSLARLWADATQCMVWAGDPSAFEVAGGALALLASRESAPPADVAEARLLRLWGMLSASHGRPADVRQEALERARELCARHADEPELCYVLADLSEVALLRGRTDAAAALAQDAVEIAGGLADPAATCAALWARATARGLDTSAAEADVLGALRIATGAGLPFCEAITRQVYADRLQSRGRLDEALEQLLLSRAVALEHGLATVAQMSGALAVLLQCDLGRLPAAGALLTGVLTGRSSGWGGIVSREAALRYAVRSGSDDADDNARRLQARAPDADEITGLTVVATHAEYLTLSGRPREALRLLCRSTREHARASATFGRVLSVWAARAAQQDGGHQEVEELLTDVEATTRPAGHVVDEAWQAALDAEVGRLRGHDEPARWQAAVPALGDAGLGFEQARCRLALARCLLGRSERGAGATALREAHAQAVEMGARGLLTDAEHLARAARISLAHPVVPEQRADLLTRREREVIGYLVAGRTYAEIAQALFISEKTVSVHVSNLLRKTGTANRLEAAAWARAQGLDGSVDGSMDG